MAMMMPARYDALRRAGADDDWAREAAEGGAAYDNRFAKIQGELPPMKWMIGFSLAISAPILAKLLT